MLLKVFLILSLITITGDLQGETSKKLKSGNYRVTSKYFNSLLSKGDPNIAGLNLFLSNMPKGGDIHHHFSGTIYVETFLDWIAEKGWKIDSSNLTVAKPFEGKTENNSKNLITVSKLRSDKNLYRKLVTLWSGKDFHNHDHNQVPPDTHFFNSFSYFGKSPHDYIGEGLKIIRDRAVRENLVYIESMLGRVGVRSGNYYNEKAKGLINQKLKSAKSQNEIDKILKVVEKNYLKNRDFGKKVNSFTKWVKEMHRGVDTDKFMMRYQTYCLRIVDDPLQVFTELLAGYIAIKKSPLLVGINILGPEHYDTSLKYYTLHMKMFNYLLRKYPEVKRAIHAGELDLGMVRPKDLSFHINEAVDIAKAHRIGHAVDIPYEKDSLKLLEKMKNSCVVEINLSSNQFILGVEGSEHPYKIYDYYGVPMVICTDDSGVLRGNLTEEYVKLSKRYRPSYKKIKEYVYNSIRYSFLEKRSRKHLWKVLDRKFLDFESKISQMVRTKVRSHQ